MNMASSRDVALPGSLWKTRDPSSAMTPRTIMISDVMIRGVRITGAFMITAAAAFTRSRTEQPNTLRTSVSLSKTCLLLEPSLRDSKRAGTLLRGASVPIWSLHWALICLQKDPPPTLHSRAMRNLLAPSSSSWSWWTKVHSSQWQLIHPPWQIVPIPNLKMSNGRANGYVLDRSPTSRRWRVRMMQCQLVRVHGG